MEEDVIVESLLPLCGCGMRWTICGWPPCWSSASPCPSLGRHSASLLLVEPGLSGVVLSAAAAGRVIVVAIWELAIDHQRLAAALVVCKPMPRVPAPRGVIELVCMTS